MVAVTDCPAAQGGEVTASARFAEPLAPHVLAAQDAGEVSGLLLVGGLDDQRRPRVQQPDEVHPDVRCPGPFGLLEKDQVLGGVAARPPKSFDQLIPA